MFPIEFLLLIRVFFLFNYLFTLRYISLFLFVDFFSFLFTPFFPFDYTLSLDLLFRPRFAAYRLVFTVLFFLHKNDSSFAVAFCVFVVTLIVNPPFYFLFCSGTDTFCFVLFVSPKNIRCCLLVFDVCWVCVCMYSVSVSLLWLISTIARGKLVCKYSWWQFTSEILKY